MFSYPQHKGTNMKGHSDISCVGLRKCMETKMSRLLEFTPWKVFGTQETSHIKCVLSPVRLCVDSSTAPQQATQTLYSNSIVRRTWTYLLLSVYIIPLSLHFLLLVALFTSFHRLLFIFFTLVVIPVFIFIIFSRNVSNRRTQLHFLSSIFYFVQFSTKHLHSPFKQLVRCWCYF